MAYVDYDYYYILSHGMFGGTAEEATTTPTERYTRILSDGLLDVFPPPTVVAGKIKGWLINWFRRRKCQIR